MTDQDRKLANFNLHEEDRFSLVMPAFVIVWTLFCIFAVMVAGAVYALKFAGWV